MWSMTLELRPSASSLMRWIAFRSTFSAGCATASSGAKQTRLAASWMDRIKTRIGEIRRQVVTIGGRVSHSGVRMARRSMKLVALALTAASLCFAADTGVWKMAPPPPASWQRDRVADLTARRKAIMDRIGSHAIVVLYAAEPRNYANDVEWPFRQENDFFYLTGLTQPGATLVIAPGAGKMREMVFIPPANPARESWTGHLITAPEAREISGIQTIHDASQLNAFLVTLIPRARALLMPAGAGGRGGGRGGRGGAATEDDKGPKWAEEFAKVIEHSGNGQLQLHMILPAQPNAVEYRREQEFAGKVASVGAGLTIKDATPMFSKLRQIKSQREIDILQHAVDITAEAFQRTYAVAV